MLHTLFHTLLLTPTWSWVILEDIPRAPPVMITLSPWDLIPPPPLDLGRMYDLIWDILLYDPPNPLALVPLLSSHSPSIHLHSYFMLNSSIVKKKTPICQQILPRSSLRKPLTCPIIPHRAGLSVKILF